MTNSVPQFWTGGWGKRTGWGWLLALALLWAAQSPAGAQTQAPNYVVITNASLIDLQDALDNPQADPWTVYLTFTNTITTDAPLYINYDTILVATTTNSVVISGGGTSEIFNVAYGVNFTMGNIIVSGGNYVGASGSNGVAGVNGLNGGSGVSGTNGGFSTGGALYNLGTTWLTNCLFLTNTATGGSGGAGGIGGNGTRIGGAGGAGGTGGYAQGGAIYNAGILVLSNCTFAGNTAIAGDGGAGATNGTPSGSSAVPGNGGTGGLAQGGALYNAGVAMVWNCTFNDNFVQGGGSQPALKATGNGDGANGPTGPAGSGGAIYNAGTNSISIVNSTFYLNLASGGSGGDGAPSATLYGGVGGNGGNGDGGSVCNGGGFIHITNCTFVGGAAYGGTNGANGTGAFNNTTTGSPGLVNGGNIANVTGTLHLKNSILATPTNGFNFYNAGTFVDQDNNLSYNTVADTTPAFTQTNSFKNRNPLLGTLAFNGGPTETMALSPQSPAVNAIYDGSAPSFDQRGFARPLGLRPCIGAYEYGLVFSVSGQLTVGTQLLPGVTVHAGNISAVTDVNGEYQLELPKGVYTIAPVPPPWVSRLAANPASLFNPTNYSLTVHSGYLNVNFSAPTNTYAMITNNAGALLVTFTGFANINYNIETSTNLLVGEGWQTNTSSTSGSNGVFTFTDSTTSNTNSRTFYRAVAQ